MKVLVTGGGGFIGRYALPLLVERGHEVHACHIEATPPFDGPGVHWHRVDLHQDAARWAEGARCDALLHLAWYAVHGLFWRSEENLRWVRTSLELVQAFRRAGGKRIVGAGTCAEYSWARAENLDEMRSALEPGTLYGVCKDALRRVLASLAGETGTSWAWGRIFFLYGPGEDRRRFVPSVMDALVDGRDAPCTHGHQVRDFLHVEDVARAFVALLESNVVGAVNVASGDGLRLADVAKTIERIVGGSGHVQLGALESRPDDPEMIVASIDRLRKEVGFQPRYSLEEGLKQMLSKRTAP